MKIYQHQPLWRILSPILCIASLIFTLIFSHYPAYTITVQDVPNPRQEYGGWVTDMVDMLSPAAEKQINQMITKLEQKNGTEIAVVTVPSTKPSPTPKAFATELFKTWGIGKKGKNNGALFLVSKSDRRTEIETGYGIESILPNAKVVDILQNQVTPKFKQGKFEAGILAGTSTLVKELGLDASSTNRGNATPKNTGTVNSNTEQSNQRILRLILLILSFVMAIIAPLLFIRAFALRFTSYGNNSDSSSSDSSSSGSSNSGSSSSGSSYSSDSGSYGGGGSGFGGGDSGGGGGGGSW